MHLHAKEEEEVKEKNSNYCLKYHEAGTNSTCKIPCYKFVNNKELFLGAR